MKNFTGSYCSQNLVTLIQRFYRILLYIYVYMIYIYICVIWYIYIYIYIIYKYIYTYYLSIYLYMCVYIYIYIYIYICTDIPLSIVYKWHFLALYIIKTNWSIMSSWKITVPQKVAVELLLLRKSLHPCQTKPFSNSEKNWRTDRFKER